jgi:hypothetical protein
VKAMVIMLLACVMQAQDSTWRLDHTHHSMLGSLPMDKVTVRKCESYAIGDIVVFKRWDKYIIHRVTAVKAGYVFTKGDFNRQPDGWTPLSDVMGKMIR